MALRRGFKAHANRIALRIREQLQLAHTDPLDPWCVCQHFDIPVLKLSELLDEEGELPGRHFLYDRPDEFSAVVVGLACGRVIVYNDSHKLPRQRSNLTHELAHCFLGHPLVPPLNEDGTRNRESEIEEEASFLGGALLIPNEAANHIVASGLGASAATIYGVSAEMLQYRIRVSGAAIRAGRRAGGITGAPAFR